MAVADVLSSVLNVQHVILAMTLGGHTLSLFYRKSDEVLLLFSSSLRSKLGLNSTVAQEALHDLTCHS